MTRDPIGIEGGINLHAYVGNGVVVYYDPEGLLHRVFDYDQSGCGVLKVFAEDGDLDEDGNRAYRGKPLLECNSCSGTKRKGKWKYKPIPPGDWEEEEPHWRTKPGKNDPFGPVFIPIPTPGTGRCGIGIHGGCGKHAYPHGTKGCIRTENDCVSRLGRLLDRNSGHHNHITVTFSR